MAHIITGNSIAILSKYGSSYIQIIGESLAKFVKVRPHAGNFKKKKSKKFKDFKNIQKDYKSNLQANHTKKPDILAKLPVINRIKMLYNSLFRKKK